MQVLEKYFDTAFDAPNGIKRLRELILTLAMQGKLVPQDTNDQPASELLKEIEKEKEKLVKEAKLKQIKPIIKIKENEIPYDLPKSWKWARLSEFAEYNGRKNISSEFIDDDVWLVDLEDIEKTTSNLIYRAKYSDRQSKSTKSTFEKNDVLYGKLRPYLDKVIVADQDGVCTTEIVPIVPYKKIDSNFLRYLLKRPAFLKFVDSLMYGVKMPRLGTQDAINSIHPLPPYQEQKRIVEKINQLMALCDELEKLKEQKKVKKLTLHKSAINQLLDSKEESNSQKGWYFISNHFNDLYTVKENVSELRSAILQLAMQGKLVPQDPNDEPASKILKEITKEKKSNKVKSLEPIKKDEIHFEIPKSWEWLRLTDCYYSIGGKKNQIQAKDYLEKGLIPVIDQGKEFIGGYCNDEEKVLKLDNPVIIFGDHTKNIKYVDFDFIIGADGVKVLCPYSSIYPRFFYFVLQTYDISNRGYARHFKLLNEKLFSLPPKNEQERIVKKINQLMALCDELEKQIKNSSLKQTELLNAITSNLGK